MFELFSKEKIKKIVFLLSTIFMFNVLNIAAIYSERIEATVRKIEDFGQKSLYFEKDFLNKYLQSNYNFGELFENKMCNYIFKKTAYVQDYGSCSENSINQILRLDFSKCILDYLKDKYIIHKDTAGMKEKISKVLTLDELKQSQKEMYDELNKIMDLLDDENAKKFIIANVGINETVANYIFSSRLFVEPSHKRQAKKVLINVDPSKEPLSRITYYFLDESGEFVFDTSVSKKKFGAQFGGILSIKSNTGIEERRFFKTHQNGSRFTGFTGEMFFSKSVSLAQPVNIVELFVYRLLEKLEIGPEVKFVVNPYVDNDIYIVTKDLGDKFNISSNISNDKCVELKDDQEMIYQLTKFDLINRILGLSDLNQGNYGVLDNGIQRSIKIVDFRAPGQPISLNNTIFKSYFNANGKIYQSNDRLITNILKNKSKDQKVEEGKDTIKKLGLSVEQFKNTVLEVKTYIENFISETDKVSNVSIKKQIGLNSDDELEELDIYADTIVSNFEFVKNYFGN